MQSTHEDLLLKGQVSALKLGHVSLLVQIAQLFLQFSMTFNAAYRKFPFYLLLNAVTVLPHAYGFLLFARYCFSDGPMNRACLPIASLILGVTTAVLIFQVGFIQLKDLGSPARRDELHIGVSAAYSAQSSSFRGGQNNRRSDPHQAIQAASDGDAAVASLTAFLAPLLALALYWSVAYSAFNGYAQRHLPAHQRQGAGSRSSRSNGRSARSQAAPSRPAQGRPDNTSAIQRIIAQNRESRERRQVVQGEVELRDQAQYQRVGQESSLADTTNTESSGDSGDAESGRRQQDFEDELAGRPSGAIPGESQVASQLRQMRLAAINRQKAQSQP